MNIKYILSIKYNYRKIRKNNYINSYKIMVKKFFN